MELLDSQEINLLASSVIDLICDSSSSESQSDDDSENEDYGFPMLGFWMVNNSSETRKKKQWEAIKNYSDAEFWHHFRVTRLTFECVVDLLAINNFKAENGSEQSSREMLYMTLKYLGGKGRLSAVSQYFSCEVSELESAIDQICNCLYLNQNQVIKWPQSHELIQVSEQFRGRADFPGVMGAIGESHIEIRSHKKLFHNCDNFYSIVCLAVVNPDKSFSYIFTGFPGSYNTTYIFQQSFLYHQLEHNHQIFDVGEYHLVGSDNFDLKPWMMVPFKEPLSVPERTFNHSLHHTRKVFDQAFDDLRRRFRRCQFIDDPAKCARIVVTSCVIHNLCVANGDRCISYFPRAGHSNGDISCVNTVSEREPSLEAQQKRRNICGLISAKI